MTVGLNQKFVSYAQVVPAYRRVFPNQETVLWFRADEGIDKDGSDNVNSWTDTLSDKGKVFSASSAADRPLWVENAINGMPGVYFNGKTTSVPKRLIQDSSFWTTADFNNVLHMFFVAIIPTDPLPSNINYWFGNTAGSNTTGQNFGVKPHSNSFFINNRFGYYKSPTTSNVRLNSIADVPLQLPFLVEMQVKGNQSLSKIVLNGVDSGTNTFSPQGTSFSSLFRIGSTTLADTPEVIISEMVLTNEILSGDDLFKARDYFNKQYNLGVNYPAVND